MAAFGPPPGHTAAPSKSRPNFVQPLGSTSKFQLHLRNLLLERIIPSVAGVVEFTMVSIAGKTICHVTCQQSKTKELWLKPDKNTPERFYVRVGPSSNELAPRDAVAYIKDHFSERER